MPFTFAHPAIVLPLKNVFGKWLSLTGLVIGSITPDFEYFLRMKIQSNYSHTSLGMLWFCLPLGMLLCFIFHGVVKKPLIANLPIVLQRKLSELQQINWVSYFKINWFVVVVSLLIGAYSHILWDSFTHQNGFFVEVLHLDASIGTIRIYKMLQHGSTLLGGLYIIWYVYNLKGLTNKVAKRPEIKYWLSIALITIVIMAVRFLVDFNIKAYGNTIVSIISAVMIAIVITSLFYRIKSI